MEIIVLNVIIQCTVHCYSTTTLSDSYQFEKQSADTMLDRGRVYQWRYSPSAVPVLFVFPTNFLLNNIKLFYESGPLVLYDNTLLGFPMLTFYPVPNGFEIWNYSNLSQLEQLTGTVQLGEHPSSTLRNSYTVTFFTIPFTPGNILTKKLLMVITFIEQEEDFSVSEIEFNVMLENSNCLPPEGNAGITITNVQLIRNTYTWSHLSLR